MKKIILLILLTIILLSTSANVYAYSLNKDDTIRIRVIANSNKKIDQLIKNQVKEALTKELVVSMTNANNVDDAKIIINNKLPKINKLIGNIVGNNDYKINYGLNYFPEKTENNITYEKGYYESLVIKIGQAKGKNWWCILFPPLCLLEAKESNKTEYRFFIEDLINTYFH